MTFVEPAEFVALQRDHYGALDVACDQLLEAGWTVEQMRSRFVSHQLEPGVRRIDDAQGRPTLAVTLWTKLFLDGVTVLYVVNGFATWVDGVPSP